jgi:DNA repair protein RadC
MAAEPMALELVHHADAPPALALLRPHYHGHRERLRARAAEHGFRALAEYEQLELILFQALPRQDVKPLAKALLEKFGSLSAVLGAPTAELGRFPRVGDSVLRLFQLLQDVAVVLAQQKVQQRDILGSWDKVIQYCQLKMQHKTIEEFHVLFLDRKNGLLADEVQQIGTVDQAPVYPREVVKRALELGASSIIMVHNHPSGDPTPSRADIVITKKVIEAAAQLDISVHDHVIIGRQGHTSMRALGLAPFS